MNQEKLDRGLRPAVPGGAAAGAGEQVLDQEHRLQPLLRRGALPHRGQEGQVEVPGQLLWKLQCWKKTFTGHCMGQKVST